MWGTWSNYTFFKEIPKALQHSDEYTVKLTVDHSGSSLQFLQNRKLVTLPLALLFKKPWRQRAYRMSRPK